MLPPRIKVNTDFKVSLLRMFMPKYKTSTKFKVSLNIYTFTFSRDVWILYVMQHFSDRMYLSVQGQYGCQGQCQTIDSGTYNWWSIFCEQGLYWCQGQCKIILDLIILKICAMILRLNGVTVCVRVKKQWMNTTTFSCFGNQVSVN